MAKKSTVNKPVCLRIQHNVLKGVRCPTTHIAATTYPIPPHSETRVCLTVTQNVVAKTEFVIRRQACSRDHRGITNNAHLCLFKESVCKSVLDISGAKHWSNAFQQNIDLYGSYRWWIRAIFAEWYVSNWDASRGAVFAPVPIVRAWRWAE